MLVLQLVMVMLWLGLAALRHELILLLTGGRIGIILLLLALLEDSSARR